MDVDSHDTLQAKLDFCQDMADCLEHRPRLSVHVAEHSFGGSHVFLKRNALRAVFGLAAMAFAYIFDYRSYRRHAKKAILLVIVLLVATLLFGRTVRGMRGFLLMFQPSEVAKLVLVKAAKMAIWIGAGGARRALAQAFTQILLELTSAESCGPSPGYVNDVPA